MKKIIGGKQDHLRQQYNQIDSLIQQIETATQEVDLSERKRTILSLQAMRNQKYLESLHADLTTLLTGLNPKDLSVRASVRKLIVQANQMDNNCNWKEFEDSFQNVHASFFENLKSTFPEISPRELRLCALIMIGLNTKEIAEITYKEVRSVESARNRLRKKLQIDQNMDLKDYLCQFKSPGFLKTTHTEIISENS